MKGHLYKNFYVMKPTIIFLAVMQVIMSAICIFMAYSETTGTHIRAEDIDALGTVFPLCCFLMFYLAGFTTTELFHQDERAGWVSFTATTPSSSRGQVLAKYYTLLIIYVFIAFFCAVTDIIVSSIVVYNTNGEFYFSSAMLVAFIFSIELFFNAVEYPFFIRFGNDKGVAIKGAAIGVVLIAMFIYFLFGDISFILEGEENPFIVLKKWLQTSGPMSVLAFVPYVSAAAFFVSYKISHRLYRKGAENYGE